MIVVADTSPLIALINLGEIEVLPRLFNTVLIPQAVLQELGDLRRPAAVRVFAGNPPVWIEVHEPQLIEAIPGLDPGEEAALALALERHADFLLIDELRGRRAAIDRHMRVAGTIGVLERAAEQNLLDLQTTFERLRATDFWIDPSLLDQSLSAFRQRREREKGRDRGPGR